MMAGRFLEMLAAMRAIRLFGREDAERRHFRESADRSYRSFVSSEMLAQLMQPFSELLYVPAFLAVFGYAWYAGVGVPSLLTFLLLLYRMQPPLKRLDQARVLLANYGPGIGEVAALLESTEAPATAPGGLPFEGLRDAVVFERVSFGYAEGLPQAIRDVSFRIGRGQVVAVVGRSGAGKSTIVNLLCRLYEPDSGQILVDGKALAGLDVRSWRQHLAVAGQDAELLARSVGDNIRFARPDADERDVESAASQALAAPFIRELPAGYDTDIGPRGSLLSGGQRQRVALARALVREPDILILDEATNAVDNITEAAIRQNIEELAGRRTIVIIAHRLNTVRRADHVVVLADGRVVEQGRPEQVIQMAGEFARMHELE
jgi:subfamily B ATP-binding cassette protein MsbA